MTISTPVEHLSLSPGVAVLMDAVRLSWQLEDRGLIQDSSPLSWGSASRVFVNWTVPSSTVQS